MMSSPSLTGVEDDASTDSSAMHHVYEQCNNQVHPPGGCLLQHSEADSSYIYIYMCYYFILHEKKMVSDSVRFNLVQPHQLCWFAITHYVCFFII